MYKTIINHVKNEKNVQVHKITPGETLFHKNYGLRICSFIRGGESPPTQMIIPRYFEFYCISHMYRGYGIYWDKYNGELNIEPGSIVCMIPGHIHFYGGNKDLYTEDSVCFYGPLADMLNRSGIFKKGILSIGKDRILLPIIDHATDPRGESQLQANINLQSLICNLHLHSLKTKVKRDDFSTLIYEIKKDLRKWWTVSQMAEFCGMSEVNFRRLFKRQFAISPKDYITKIKISAASEMLSSTTLPLAKIAKELGFYDPFHFSRRFKMISGISPSDYRKNTRYSY